MAQTKCTVICEGEAVEEILGFEYHSVVTSITDEASFTVDDKGHKWRDKLRKGQEIQFILQHPEVNGGQPTVRHRGRITRRRPRSTKGSGTEIVITSSDAGWHLEQSSAPIWFRINGKRYPDVFDPTTTYPGPGGKPFHLFHPSWNFKGLYVNGELRRAGKLGQSINLGAAAAAQRANKALDPCWCVQIEPGDAIGPKIVEYARRYNQLLNVMTDAKGDRFVCLYLPNYDQKPLYSIRCVEGNDQNNVLEGELDEDARTCWTEVVCTGDQIDAGIASGGDPTSPNAKKKRGVVLHPGALPFHHSHAFNDGEMFENGLAQKCAEWEYKQGQFAAFALTYKLDQHHQGGHWLDADTMASVEDSELGVGGNFWVEQVHCFGSKTEEDFTQLVLRLPHLLSASFGVYPHAPVYRANGSTGTPTAGQ